MLNVKISRVRRSTAWNKQKIIITEKTRFLVIELPSEASIKIIISEWMRCNSRRSLRNELFHWPSFSLTEKKKRAFSFFFVFVPTFSSFHVMSESARVLLSGTGTNDFPVVFYASHTTHRTSDSWALALYKCERLYNGATVRTSSLKLFLLFIFRVLLIIRLVPTAFLFSFLWAVFVIFAKCT